MSLRLSIFTPKMMQSFILPKISNADHSIILDKVRFGFDANAVIEMQVIDDEWTFKKSPSYLITRDGGGDIDEPLKNEDLFTVVYKNETMIKISVSEVNVSIESLKKYHLSKKASVTIGRSDNNVICYDVQKKKFIGSNHAVISFGDNNWYIEERSKNGVFLNGVRIEKDKKLQLKICDIIDIYGLKIVFLGEMIAVGAADGAVIDEGILKPYETILQESDTEETIVEEKKFFHRAPRKNPKIYAEEVEIEAPPTLRKPEQRPLIMTIGPSLTMSIPMMIGCGIAIMASRASGMASGAFMYTGIVTAVGSAVIGASWTMANLKYSKKQIETSENARFEAYGNCLVGIAEKIKGMYTTNVA